jgi:hypothetical protein
MPRRKERFDLEKVTVKLFHGDFAKLRELYPKHGANFIIRELIHRHIGIALEAGQRATQNLPSINIDLNDLETAHDRSPEQPDSISDPAESGGVILPRSREVDDL